MDTWDRTEADRLALADYLSELSPAEWSAPSLCADWAVRDVAAHLLVGPTMSKGKIFRSVVGAGFNLDKMSATLIARMTGAMSDAELASTMRATAGSRSAPPGLKPIGVFGEVVVHASDISLAVGKPLTLPLDHYVIALDHMKGVQPVLGCKKRIAGLRLHATDAGWSTGDGPAVEGDAQHLLAAMTGRRQALSALSGDGVAVLQGR